MSASVRLQGTQTEEWAVTATVPAATPAGQAVAATVQPSPTEAAQAQLFCPERENWHIEDIFTDAAAPATNMALLTRVDRFVQPYAPSYGAVLITNLSRMKPSRTIGVGSGSSISFQIVPLALVGAAAITLIFRVKVARYAIKA